MDIGSLLHEARTRRGLTLPEISRATKVPVAMLDHLEHNRFDRLPGTIFTRGYLRAFALAVGVEGEALVQDFNQQSAPPPAAARQTRAAAAPPPKERRIGWAGISLVAIAAVAYFALTREQLFTSSPASAPPVPAAAELPRPVPTSGAATATPAPAERSVTWPVQVEMTVSGDCWVSATADSHSAVYRLVKSGERLTVTANDEVVLRVGEPAVFSYSLNGAPGRPVGKPGAPATVRINRETYRDLLVTPPSAATATLGGT